MKKMGLPLVVLFLLAAVANAQPPEPNEHHKLLMENVGTWDVVVSIWAGGPDAEPEKAEAVEVVKPIGDFWIQSEIEYPFMGMTVKGHSVIGYDPDEDKLVGQWYDSMSPHVSRMVGEYDAETKTFKYDGKVKDVAGGVSEFKIVERITGEKTKRFEFFMAIPGGEKFKMLQMDYTKRDE